MIQANESDILRIGKVLNDPTRPLKERFRALFTLKNIGGLIAIDQIRACFEDSSALLKHELAYCLGQMQDPAAIDILTSVLEDLSQEPMVRHEAGEALGAIGELSVIPLLEKYCKDPIPEVAETCELAMSRLRWLQSTKNTKNLQNNLFLTIDPAPPTEITDVNILREILLNEKKSLFDRYRAMFSLRNLGTADSILALVEGLRAGSALFRHEIAFVLGQLQEKISVPGLQASLENTEENEMVRHECAEALGSIATPECYEILHKYLNDSKRVVRESCIIALDMCDYENSSEFQYADTLAKIAA
ncbi:deoxyhypusine hydroxylase [Pseudomyrmex gracilis]|uniref:deoxyhypusine hydroxylase n=1 Tax=Pseudomyrmex gracilis TaxID=219809 RepID=UPI000994E459|nr:deoxyhypusine hydroxylase [Pseudomyrmex gracilis]XP_020298789.1 deoxyhypusine hydroxylase [Pseudomyrmex gracilis]XP_020298790.1 deoxyhypusine hydroxylase [Pseudomyrmex gracilis]